MKPSRTALILLSLLALIWAAGCTTNQTTAAYKAENAADLSVTAAMTGWGAYVAAKHPGTNVEQKVFTAFQLYQNAELSLVQASAAVASSTNADGSPQSTVQAKAALDAAQLYLVNLITSLTNSPPK